MIKERIEKLRSRNEYLTQQLAKRDILTNPQLFKKFAREQNDLHNILDQYKKLQKFISQI